VTHRREGDAVPRRAGPGTVQVRFFASYADLVGREEMGLELPLPTTVADVIRQLREQFPWARPLPERPLAAVNLCHVPLEAPVVAGDEVALLPPLAGG
jgi:molybdopterin converting factor small subunit